MRADSRPVRGGPWYLFSNTSFESCTAPCPHLGAARTAEMRRLRWVRAGRKSLRRLNHKWNPASPQNPHHTVLRARPRHPRAYKITSQYRMVKGRGRAWRRVGSTGTAFALQVPPRRLSPTHSYFHLINFTNIQFLTKCSIEGCPRTQVVAGVALAPPPEKNGQDQPENQPPN